MCVIVYIFATVEMYSYTVFLSMHICVCEYMSFWEIHAYIHARVDACLFVLVCLSVGL